MPDELAERIALLSQHGNGAPAPGDKLERLAGLCRQLLVLIGEDPERPGLRDTPMRWARWWLEFAEYSDPNAERVFAETRADQLVLVSGIRVWSLCEHHLLGRVREVPEVRQEFFALARDSHS
jgi:GTP cyclohydrolase I